MSRALVTIFLALALGVSSEPRALEGRVTFLSDPKPAPDLSRLLVQMWNTRDDEARTKAKFFMGPNVEPKPVPVLPDGSFTFQNVPPGQYFVGALRVPTGWWLRSVRFDDKDVTDSAFDFADNGRLVLGLSDQHNSVSGLVRDSSGNPYQQTIDVVVFPRDPKAWRLSSVRIQSVRVGPGGRYSITDLLPGDYLIAVQRVQAGQVTDITSDRQRRELESLSLNALVIRLPESGSVEQNLTAK